jgi:hypothetical protein
LEGYRPPKDKAWRASYRSLVVRANPEKKMIKNKIIFR